MTTFKEILVTDEEDGIRIDKMLSDRLSDISRTQLQKMIENGLILVNGKSVSSKYKVDVHDNITISFPREKKLELKPEKVDLELVFENDDIAIINKPAGMVVHPSDDGQNSSGTLVNALMGKFKTLSTIGGEMRPGIVHRLDKDTSGLLIIAKNNQIHEFLIKKMKARKIYKKYLALVFGHIAPESGRIEAPMARSSRDRKKFGITDKSDGKKAVSEYKVRDYYTYEGMKFTLIEVNLITGRTHQIRVHFQSIGFPVAGDILYGNRKANNKMNECGLNRQFLHAYALRFTLPDRTRVNVKKDLPDDLKKVLDSLEKE